MWGIHGMGSASAAFGAALALSGVARAEVRVPACFGDHMVLQCERPARLFGEGVPGERVELRFGSPDGRSLEASAVVGADGRWAVVLEPQPPGGPWQVTIESDNELSFEDVWFGEVWLCAGQSNMEWPLAESDDGKATVQAAGDPNLRLLRLERVGSAERESDVPGAWRVCSPGAAAPFSALAYHFGRGLRACLDRPVGLVQAAWNGTPIEAWIPAEHLRRNEELRSVFERWKRSKFHPGDMFNGMIAPLASCRFRGVLWYQGESNHLRADQYRRLFPELIRSWREEFGDEDLPFVYTQMPNIWAQRSEPSDSSWAELREAQAMALSLPQTAMAVTIDLGSSTEAHPRNKRDFAERMLLQARALVYGHELVASGPRFRSASFEGNEAVVSLDSIGGGLKALDGKELSGFSVAGEDRVFHWAGARLEGDRVRVASDAVPAPRSVRYAWADNPGCNLGNVEGLPAAPFRSDDWPGVTSGAQ